MAVQIPHFKLNNGTMIPSVGMGCWMGTPGGGQRVYDMCASAIKAGYRHFDTADGYANEEHVGRAITDSGIPRSEFYVTTKLNNNAHHRVREAFDKSLAALGTDYIDLFLVHWPQASVDGRTLAPDESPTIVDTWKEMEKLLDTGKVKSIGVSNFGVPLLKTLLAQAKVVPVTNQVELHPCLPLQYMRKYCAEHDIVLTAYSPLGRPMPGQNLPTFLGDEPVKGIASRLGATEAQVVLSWGVQQGVIVVPKSENPDRMKANITLVHLEPSDIEAINGIHKQSGHHRSLLGYHKEDGTVFGYTYEQLGWDMTKGGVVSS